MRCKRRIVIRINLQQNPNSAGFRDYEVLFKMDKAGEGQEVCLSDLPRCRELSFVGFTHTMFVEMCVMAGCDFLKALPGIGIKKAHACIKKMRSFDRVRAILAPSIAVALLSWSFSATGHTPYGRQMQHRFLHFPLSLK